MRRLCSLLLVCAMASTASADGFYFTEGVGGTRVHDELSQYMQGGLRIRLSMGVRHDRWAVEGWIAGAINDQVGYGDGGSVPVDGNPQFQPNGARGGAADLTMYGLDLKYINPLSRHLEVYLRGTMSAAEADGALYGYAGRGLGFGAGVQLKGKVPALGFLWWPFFFTDLGPKVTAALWLDDGYEFYRLHGPAPTAGRGSVAIDAQLTHLTMGFAVGSDF